MSAPASTKQPMRRCAICREPAPKQQMLRVVRRPDGTTLVSDRAQGRGAYVHRSDACLHTAAANPKPLARALRQTPPADLLGQISTEPVLRDTDARPTDLP